MKQLLSSLVLGAALFAAPTFAQDTIVDIVLEASGGATAGEFDRNGSDYDILINALQTADLVGALADPNADLTVFAPQDRSFIRLARDLGFRGRDEEGAWNFLVDALTQLGNGNPVPVLTDVLLYHVADGQIGPFDLILATFFRRSIETLQGATIRPFFFTLIDNDPDFRNPFVVLPFNIRASNGRIHSISRVLLPIDLP